MMIYKHLPNERGFERIFVGVAANGKEYTISANELIDDANMIMASHDRLIGDIEELKAKLYEANARANHFESLVDDNLG